VGLDQVAQRHVDREVAGAAATAFQGPSWSMANSTAGMAAISEPTLGTKLRRNASIPQRMGKSTPMIPSHNATSVPVASEMAVLMAR
jgi:hypothetical protein